MCPCHCRHRRTAAVAVWQQAHQPPDMLCRHLVQIDAFTAAAFGGNPAAVVLLPPAALPVSDDMRQKVAAEMNLSETAYLETTDGSSDFSACTRFRLRWFTPAIEVGLYRRLTGAVAAA